MLKKSGFLFTAIATVTASITTGASAQEVVSELQIAPAVDTKAVIESETGSYIIVMEQDPVVVAVGQDGLGTPTADALADGLEDVQDDVLEEIGADGDDKVNTYTDSLNGFSAAISYADAQKLASDPRVATVLPDEWHQTTTDSSAKYLGLTRRGGAYDTGLTGEGVIVGVIDNGIWPEHPSFADDGTYPDLGIVLDDSERPNCEFGNTAHNPEDVPFTCNNKLLGARQMLDSYRAFIGAEPFEYDSARDDNGHGTHTASTAAGNADVDASILGRDLGTVTGIAPRARVIAYKGLGALGGFTSDLAAAIDQAVADGVDVINYSVGGGASVPTGGDDLAFLFAANAGVFVATSAGNSGPDSDTVGSPANSPWLTSVGASTQRRFFQGDVNAFSGDDDDDDKWWKGREGSEHYRYDWRRKRDKGLTVSGASLTLEVGRSPLIDAEDLGNELCLPDLFEAGSLDGAIVLCRRGQIGRVAKGEHAAAAGAVGMVLYNFDDNDDLFTDPHVLPAVHINFTDGTQLKDYIDEQQAAGATPEAEIADTGEVTRDRSAPSMTYFSSRGQNGPVPDIIKPDVTAPGHQILAGDVPTLNPFGDEFQAISGTSMSSPHVAGLFALIKQAHPDWTAAMAKSAIMTTADTRVRTEDRVTQATPFDMGAGEIDPGRVKKKGSVFNPGLVYDAGLFEYAGFTCGADYGIFSADTCDFLALNGIPFDASDLNMASIGVAQLAGSQTVIRTVTSVADKTVTYRPRVREPQGFDVSVSPSRFKLAPGASQTIEITITNESAPVGEWRFGSLQLRGGGYKVVSPIAVNASAIDTAGFISGTGVDGTASFDVTFGYEGAYTAAPHGLVASTVLAGAIGQDPDQTAGSPDDAPGPDGGVDAYAIDVVDTALLQISLAIPGDDDIDLFLLDPAGNLAAASTNGGTDELIELVLPADGVYTLLVHGWSIPSAPLDYAVDTWAVPLTPGTGPLSVTSAPTSATLAVTAPIDIAWSGLDPDTSYLGAVSHSDGAGLIGLTLVSVET